MSFYLNFIYLKYISTVFPQNMRFVYKNPVDNVYKAVNNLFITISPVDNSVVIYINRNLFYVNNYCFF